MMLLASLTTWVSGNGLEAEPSGLGTGGWPAVVVRQHEESLPQATRKLLTSNLVGDLKTIDTTFSQQIVKNPLNNSERSYMTPLNNDKTNQEKFEKPICSTL